MLLELDSKSFVLDHVILYMQSFSLTLLPQNSYIYSFMTMSK